MDPAVHTLANIVVLVGVPLMFVRWAIWMRTMSRWRAQVRLDGEGGARRPRNPFGATWSAEGSWSGGDGGGHGGGYGGSGDGGGGSGDGGCGGH